MFATESLPDLGSESEKSCSHYKCRPNRPLPAIQRAMITTLPPQDNHNRLLDDMSLEIILLAAIGISTPILASATGTPDMFAVPGAILAAFVAILKANQEKRTWSEKGIVAVGTTVVGSTAPSAAVWYWGQDAAQRVIPHLFMLAGFMSGLVGWTIFWGGLIVLDRRKEKIIEKELQKRGFMNPEDETKP